MGGMKVRYHSDKPASAEVEVGKFKLGSMPRYRLPTELLVTRGVRRHPLGLVHASTFVTYIRPDQDCHTSRHYWDAAIASSPATLMPTTAPLK